LVTEKMKKAIGRERPSLSKIARRKFNLRGLLTNPAFPSGDSAQVSHRCPHSSSVWLNALQAGVASSVLALYTNNPYWYILTPLGMFRSYFPLLLIQPKGYPKVGFILEHIGLLTLFLGHLLEYA
jgi:hypothetical protein